MLYAVCIAPLLAAFLFRFGIPYIETLLCNYFGKPAIISDYYLLFDLFLAVMTPYMFCFVSSMVILTEYDENMASYMAVTPVGKGGYIISRLLFPAVFPFSPRLSSWFFSR
jgi:fluoroquinolone transport system permease protein